MQFEKSLLQTGSQTLLPLTAAQNGIWFGQMLDPARPYYNIGRYLEVRGPVDPHLFEKALRAAVTEIDGLHLHFIETEDGPRQYCGTNADWPMPFFDVSGEADPHAAAIAWM
ncbi:MAG: condensation domain-containing protein, partial [Alphaproteobacteria bacterium]|nr:condensation domain-containing protein [Alphaproteobacteria bacterium]